MKNSHWIWCPEQNVHGYNQAALFKKEFITHTTVKAELRITADSYYRVFFNGVWINDGPGRAYPEHYSYDVYDITSILKKGKNLLEVTARYFGIGTFHQIPQQAGLLAELEIDGTIHGTDSSWMAAPMVSLRKWIPKVSIQMEPAESVDARKTKNQDWKPAIKLFKADQGPWKDLSPRRSGPLTKISTTPIKMHHVLKIKSARQRVCIPVTQIAHTGRIEANRNTSRPVILTALLYVQREQTYNFSSKEWKIIIQGVPHEESLTLQPEQYRVYFFCKTFLGHDKEIPFPFLHQPETQWSSWQVFVKGEFLIHTDDRIWDWFENPIIEEMQIGWKREIEEICSTLLNKSELLPDLGVPARISLDQLFMEDYTADFSDRLPSGSALNCIENQTALFDGGFDPVIIHPVSGMDVEMCYDLGKQNCGYFQFSFKADAGTVIDLHMVEYITKNGVLQHTKGNRNGMRYVAKAGINSYTSLKRRSGRYLFVTIRNQTSPVEFEKLNLIESTADIKPAENFHCSDKSLNGIWEISERTLKLCMEDVFTDCPLYEQTLWIGDARNEALYAFQIYGNYTVSERSLELGAQSLEHFPIVGCQVPSCWDTIIPAWSFLWGIHVWEHYFYSGNLIFLKELWPGVMENLNGAFDFLNKEGLFSSSFWNLMEWSPIDHEHETVFHNNLLLVGALRAAEKCALALDDQPAHLWLTEKRTKLIQSIHPWWDPLKKSYPDALLDNGEASTKICQHTSVLAIMCGVLPKKRIPEAKEHLLRPPSGMTLSGSPFAAQFLFEALEIMGESEAIMESIRHQYIPMIDKGATTVWETYPGSLCSPSGFPTRSHCHGWSCSPLLFINRIVLGIKQISPGGKSFNISPWIQGLYHAKGSMSTPKGNIHVEWKTEGKKLNILVSAPKGTKINFPTNKSHKGFIVRCETQIK